MEKKTKKMPKEPKFTQLVVGPWKSDNSNLNHNLYALGSDGKVYQWYAKSGWERKQVKTTPAKAVDDDPF